MHIAIHALLFVLLHGFMTSYAHALRSLARLTAAPRSRSPRRRGGGRGQREGTGNEEKEHALKSYIAHKFLSGRWTGIECAEVSWLIGDARGRGVKDFAVRPETATHGHGAAKLEKALGLDTFERKLYRAYVPIYDKVLCKRVMLSQPFILPEEHVYDALVEHGVEKFSVANYHSITPDIRNNSIVRRHGLHASGCLTLFVDAAPYSNNDSIFMWYLTILPLAQRFMITVMKKEDLCDCGCRGQCTIQAIEHHIVESLRALAANKCQEQRCDGQHWQPGDAVRKARAGLALGLFFALVEYRADWAQVVFGFGFRNWKSHRLCFKCFATRDTCYQFNQTWEPISNDDVMQDLMRRLLRVVISDLDTLKELFQAMIFDRRKKGKRGRCLSRNFPNIGPGLACGDRLEVGGDIKDTHANWESLPIPCHLLFYRYDREAILTHISQLWRSPGFQTRYIKGDALHVMDCQGVTSAFEAKIIYMCLQADVLHTGTHADGQAQALRLINRGLRLWYSRETPTLASKSRIGKITMTMLGE